MDRTYSGFGRAAARGLASLILTALLAASAYAAAGQPLPAPKPLPFKRITEQTMRMSVPAKILFKKVPGAAPLKPSAIGRYARGCLAGAEQLPADGQYWQAMRLSRNRRWAHPLTIKIVKRLAVDAATKDGWPGLLVGDMSMARGGPMWPSHASHQIGLDADIWLTPMPNRRLTRRERESLSATYMLTKDQLSVNPAVWTPEREKLLKRIASYPEVQRVLVHPAIKRQLCKTAGKDRAWLSKMRPVWGHNYHFHVRLFCPPGSKSCRPQRAVPKDDGCGLELTQWYKRLHARLKKVDCKDPKNQNLGACFCRIKANKTHARCRPRPRRWITLADMPRQCSQVLAAK